jgi:hypothetical protein
MLMGVHISVFINENFIKTSQPHIDPNEACEAHEILIQITICVYWTYLMHKMTSLGT